MIDFHKPTIEDKEWITGKIEETGSPSCEYTFGNIFAYTAKMEIMVAECFSCLVTRCIYNGELMYCYPMGNGDKKAAVEATIEDARCLGRDFTIFGLTKDFADELEDTVDNLKPLYDAVIECGVEKDKEEIYKHYCKMKEVREKDSVL